MKKQALILLERHPSPRGIPDAAFLRRAVALWLTKELRR